MSRLYPIRGLRALVAIFALAAAKPPRAPIRRRLRWPAPFPACRLPLRGRSSLGGRDARSQLGTADSADRKPRHERTSRTIWLQLEVGTDASFSQIVHQADQITPGGDGRTVVPAARAARRRLHLLLARARVRRREHRPVLGGLELQRRAAGRDRHAAPTEPQGNINTNRPEFKVRNGAISGTTGVVYRIRRLDVGRLQPDRRAR